MGIQMSGITSERAAAIEASSRGLAYLFTAHRERKAALRDAPPPQECDVCGRHHWHPAGTVRCVSCELAR